MEKIIVFDFGGQTAQLIARRIREIGVYSEIVPGDINLDHLDKSELRGIILSGSPMSVYDADSAAADARIYDLGIPILGICYGLQRMTADRGGKVALSETREYGRSKIEYKFSSPLFKNIPEGFVSWMSHGDAIQEPAIGWEIAAVSENGLPAAIINEGERLYGLQFHPEVTHCEYGTDILKNFAYEICRLKPNWNMEHFLDMASIAIQEKVQGGKVLLLISGGVDSTVVAALLLKALHAEQVHLMYVDTGLMRKNETVEIKATLNKLGAEHIHIIYAADKFFKKLADIDDPEKKRHIIGDLFMQIQEEEIPRLGLTNVWLAQGTLYPDMIESGSGVGKKAHVIKSHHNVRSPLVQAKRESGRLLEPLAILYKDEVRQLGRQLGLSENVIGRHPFPGPGLAVRILSDITPEKVRILQEADTIYISELKKRGLYNEIWQAFAVLLPTRTVGVTGDARKYGYVLGLRAVTSHDAMTADVYPFPMNDLLEISSRITNQVPEIGRVVYDVSSKPPATIEWE
jgi:GMP synthase (glutamine-hydrolysing)